MIEAFLNDLKENQSVMKLLGNPINTIDDCLNEVAQLRANQKSRDYAVLRLKNKDYEFFEVVDGKLKWKTSIGTVLSVWDGTIDRPWRVRKVNDEIWVVSENKQVARFDLNFSFLGFFGEWGSFSESYPNRYEHPRGIAVTEDRVFLAFDKECRVGCYDRTGERIWLFGDGTSGRPENGRLYNPCDVAILPNGNILVACYNGRPQGATASNGYISEHKKEDGSLVKVHFKYARDGYPWNGDVCHPSTIRMIQRPDEKWELWIVYDERKLIGVFEYNETEGSFTYKTCYSLQSRIRDFVVDASYEKIYLTTEGPARVVCLSIETHDVVGQLGVSRLEDYEGASDTKAGFAMPTGIELSDDRILVADYTNNRLQQFPLSLIEAGKVEIEYEGEMPCFKKIDFCSESRFDLEKMTLEDMPQNLLVNPAPEQIVVCGVF
jgi:hypothetical protein